MSEKAARTGASHGGRALGKCGRGARAPGEDTLCGGGGYRKMLDILSKVRYNVSATAVRRAARGGAFLVGGREKTKSLAGVNTYSVFGNKNR